MAVGDKLRSSVWGNTEYEISQEFGTYDPETASMYPAEYTEPLGFPAGTHVGLDVYMPKHTKLFAMNPGKVMQSGSSDYFRPKPVWIVTDDNPDTMKDESGYIEIYGHMWTNTVTTGQRVKQGDALGTSGEQTHVGTMNPDGTGEHLHFELRKPVGAGEYRAVNPRSWLTASQFAPGEEPEPPNDTPTLPGGIDIGGATELIENIGQRSVFVVVGIVLLAIGAYAVLKA